MPTTHGRTFSIGRLLTPAFDYAADSWGYTYGGTVEWTQSWWTLRQGLFDLSRTPNSKYLDRDFLQFEVATEAEERHELFGRTGKLKFLFWVNRVTWRTIMLL
jgi:high affinity Mn2+ porin